MDERDFKAMNKIKTVNVYGVEMTPIQNFKFSQYLDKSDVPSMNTLTKEERFEVANNWLNKQLLT